MNMEFENINEAWSAISLDVVTNGRKVAGTRELNNVSFTIKNVDDNVLTVRSKFALHYYLGEMIWYAVGDNSVDFISRYGKIWEILSDDGITNNSAYGYILQHKHGFNQIEKIVELLQHDKDSRRAVININVPNENVIETKDEMCTIALQFLIRDGKLDATGIMRSNDLWTGTPYDIFYFTEIQKLIARKLGVSVGKYHHYVTSIHVYDRNIDDIYDSIQNYRTGKYENHKINGEKLFKNAKMLYDIINATPRELSKQETLSICKQLKIIK